MTQAKDTPVAILVRFSRLVAGVPSAREILPMLARAAIEHIGADAAAVLRVGDKGQLELAAECELPDGLDPAAADLELGDVGAWFVRNTGGRFAASSTLPLVSSTDLFGALVLLFERPCALEPDKLELAGGLVDLTAVALGKAFQYAELHRSFVELRASREMLVRTEKLRALGQAAAGIAHDLKNIFNPLRLQVELLKRRLAAAQRCDTEEIIGRFERIVLRGIDTVERLRDFSRQSPSGPSETCDLNQLVQDAIELLMPRVNLRGTVNLAIQLGEPPPVLLESSQLVTALLNLMVNSLEAIPAEASGTITLSSGCADSGGWVRVADDGPGIPPEIEQHIFEPFFTTKGQQGTGLGLALVYALVQRHGGRISLETGPDKGTTFTLWFPAAPPESAEPAPPAPQTAAPVLK
ncbi:MAG TPA: HAMP domain-containing sensor histidine kinase [Polyangia bacterium]|jgi:signal transduction histidine kinase|nr:HAMP domain-containing sensor histidine kinase [Polyangia bacterium]